MPNKKEFRRRQAALLLSRLQEKRRFIQVLAGPRQTGKTTIARQVAESLQRQVRYASADEPGIRGAVWIEQEWEAARTMKQEGSVLVLDEVQKIPGWSETVKRLWDADTRLKTDLRVVVLGSAPLLIQKGLTESLAGRFEIIPVTHWSFTEMRKAFDWTLEEYLYYGGYPGSASLIGDRERWARYIMDSLIETTISRDILLMTRVDKPALLRQLFHVGCSYSGQIVSYQKLVGQLHDAGNTTTLAHYLHLLQGAGMLAGIQKYSGKKILQRSSSPKLIVLNSALMSAVSHLSLAETKSQPALWGRLVESAVGAHLINSSTGGGADLYYWREGEREVDYVLQRGKDVLALEVKSGRKPGNLRGMESFSTRYKFIRTLLIGEGGISVSDFLESDPVDLMK
jgi:predicted AAA+ superfamily ATPase